jgi:hypothetical protein
MNIRIVYSPTVKPSEFAPPPYIDMADPIKPKERLIPELTFGDEGKPEEVDRYFFDVSLPAAQRILAMDSEIYQLWEPEILRVPVQNGFSQVELKVVKSVKELALAGATNLRDPESVPKIILPSVSETPEVPVEPVVLQDDPIARATAAAVAAAGGKTK